MIVIRTVNCKWCGMERSWPTLRYSKSTCLEGMREIMEPTTQDSRISRIKHKY
jgi:hypothetical protein